MKKLKLDKNGVPILSRIDIEERAEHFIRFFDNNCLKEPRLTPLPSICIRLKKEYDVNFVFGADLGESKEGYKYRGRFHIPSKTIYIDKSMPEGEARFNFTLAHELGHFVFHRNINLALLSETKDDEISDTSRDLILDQVQGDNPRTWLEWQANKFASSLLLPRATVIKAVIQKQIEMGINKNIGKIFVNQDRSSYSDYKEQMEQLCLIYQSSKSSIRIRLRELNILFERIEPNLESQNKPAHLSGFLKNVIDDW